MRELIYFLEDHWRDILSIVLIVSVVLLVSSCGYVDREIAKATGYSTICDKDKGVEYIQFTSGATVRYNPDGSLVRCE